MDIEERKKKAELLRQKFLAENTTEKRRGRVIERMTNMKPFGDGFDNECPDIPRTDNDTYRDYVIPNLIRCGAIPKDKLIIGAAYFGHCRNADEAIWNGEVFIYNRTKFGDTYPEKINHFEDDNGYDLFIPIKLKKENI
jgi:hypothetical protein